MKRAWIFGDSHAAGSGILPNNTPQEYLESYPCQLARTLGHKQTLNHSVAGHSNDAIFRWVTEQINNIQPEDLVILCWTEEARTEFWSEAALQWLYLVRSGQSDVYDLWHPLKPCENALQGIIDVERTQPLSERHFGFKHEWEGHLYMDQYLRTWRMNFVRNVLAANHLLRNKNITAMNIRSLCALNLPTPQELDPALTQEWWPVGATVFRSWALENGFEEDAYHHLPLLAHTAFADYVYQQIKHTR